MRPAYGLIQQNESRIAPVLPPACWRFARGCGPKSCSPIQRRRELTPYLGVTWSSKCGPTADFAEAAGEDRGRDVGVVSRRFGENGHLAGLTQPLAVAHPRLW